MKNPDVLVFDFDGTLSDSIPSAYSAICAVFDAHELPHPLLEEVIEHLAPPFVDFYYKRGVPRLFSPEKIWEIYKPLANHGGARLFGDAVPTLSSFRRLGHRLALVTSQTRSVIAPLLESSGIAGLFDRIETDAMPKHPHLVAVRDYFENGDSSATQPLYVGDMCDDMRAAKDAGFMPIGIVRHGNIGKIADLLYRAGARRVVSQLQDILLT